MRYKYYGTAAAEGIPALYCTCDLCNYARKNGGKDLRSRTQITIDDEILIDYPADTFMHTLQGLPLTKIHNYLISHVHHDHFYPEDMNMRKEGFSHLEKSVPSISVYLSDVCVKHAEAVFFPGTEKYVVFNEIKAFVSFLTNGYRITPLKANHLSAENPMIFLIEKDSKCILHAHDTGYFPEETWEYLKSIDVHIDFASFDCCEPMDNRGDRAENHMNFQTVLNVKNRLSELGLLDDKTICVINHFSHNGNLNHSQICDMAEKEGFIVSYDGLEIVF